MDTVMNMNTPFSFAFGRLNTYGWIAFVCGELAMSWVCELTMAWDIRLVLTVVRGHILHSIFSFLGKISCKHDLGTKYTWKGIAAFYYPLFSCFRGEYLRRGFPKWA